MLNKLKRKIVAINMILVGAVLLIVLAAICVLTYRSDYNDIQTSLEGGFAPEERPNAPEGRPADFRDRRDDGPFKEKMGGRFSFTYIYDVVADADGNVTDFKIHSSSDEEEKAQISGIVPLILAEGKEKGVLSGYDYYYRVQTLRDGYEVSFTSRTPLVTSLRKTVLICAIVFVGSLVVFFFISYALASYAVKPVGKAWEQQKTFVADASHDLKTPLTVVLANSDMLISHKDEKIADELKWVESTREEATYMRSLVEKMLELAKTENTEKLALSKVNISEKAELVALQLEPIAFERGIEFESKIEKEVFALCDGDMFQRLCNILIDNAIKYGEDRVRVTLEKRDKHAVLRVNNSGKAIDPDRLAHIFERFYRADDARTVGGHGLGLSIARNIVRSFGGKIDVVSNGNDGTTFTVTLHTK